ncbi:hypothetical protein [Micromonospora wenchangensis]
MTDDTAVWLFSQPGYDLRAAPTPDELTAAGHATFRRIMDTS